MKQIIPLPNKRLVWYLALEEYLAERVSEEQIFFWVVPPTVIFGRHQVMENEVNLDYCRRNGVQFYRRKSGGGCVYADSGNLMISYITPDTHSEAVFQRYLDLFVSALSTLGYPAVKSEHNDILVSGRKVSGNACYALPTGTIVHGTMLWDVDFAALQQAITPSREKLAKHGVESVRQRVVNLSSITPQPVSSPLLRQAFVPGDIHTLQSALAALLCTSEAALSPEDLCAVDRIEQDYLSPDFIKGV